MKPLDTEKLDRIVAQARRDRDQREAGYRERALRMYPWVCGRCAREFTRANVQELTVHHRNHATSTTQRATFPRRGTTLPRLPTTLLPV